MAENRSPEPRIPEESYDNYEDYYSGDYNSDNKWLILIEYMLANVSHYFQYTRGLTDLPWTTVGVTIICW